MFNLPFLADAEAFWLQHNARQECHIEERPTGPLHFIYYFHFIAYVWGAAVHQITPEDVCVMRECAFAEVP